ncbi:MAG TPA: AMP-binding protein [Candidatus Limnocylindrales bacterium]|nr:AMP-binding protein [Candidatus Limnocylindrales bacterium]
MNHPFAPFPKEHVEQSVPALFEGQVERTPGRLAIKGRRHALTYRALDRQADRLAHAIVARRGHGRETVALIFEHDAPAIAAILGVLKAGKIYVGLDPRHPPARLARILADSEAPLLVFGAGFAGLARKLAASSGCEVLEAEALDPAAPAARLGLSIAPSAPACICDTGGSTGEPKGVVLDHRGLLHRIMTYVNRARIGPDDRLSLLHSMSVTGSFRQMYGALLTGAAVYPFDLGHEGLAGLGAWLRAERITVCHLAASVFRHFAGALTGTARRLEGDRAATARASSTPR